MNELCMIIKDMNTYNTNNESAIVVENYYRYYKTFARTGIVDCHESPVNWILPKPGEKGPSLAFNIRLEPETAEEIIREHIKGIRKRKVPEIWFITPDSTPDNIISILERNGFKNLSSESNEPEPGMLLSKDDFCPYPTSTDGMICRKVQSKADFRIWIDIVNTALHGWEMIDAKNYYTWVENGVYDFYLAEIDGTPVSTVATIRNGDTASMEFVSTLNKYRRRKAAITLSTLALDELFANGVKNVTLSGSVEAVALYKKLGFHSCFHNILMKYSISD